MRGEDRQPPARDVRAGRSAMDRREFVRLGLAAGAAVGPLGGLATLAGCEQSRGRTRFDAGTLVTNEPAHEVFLVADVGEMEVAPGRVYRTWLYNGQFPGPEIRLREGERLRVTLENRLPDPTTIHWHGVPVPNPMDGVPGVTQAAVPPGGRFVYEYVARPAGSYMYHSHVGLQLDRGLVAPLIIEEREPHVAYDREHTLVLDDWLPTDPVPATDRREGMMSGMMDRMMRGRGMMGGMRGMMGQEGGQGMMLQDPARPDYATLLINGRAPEEPPVFEVRTGERVRLRLLNLASATTFRVAITGHRMIVTHTDARPVEPVTVDALVIGMGERYDVVVEARNPGTWLLTAESALGAPAPARAVLRYADARASAPGGRLPSGLREGRLLRLADLRSVEAVQAAAPVDRSFDLTLSGGMMMHPNWTIEGQSYPDADPLEIRSGERVRVSLVNMSMIHHPMHLHGHFFRVRGALKETVLVPAHMGRVRFEFTADNPGDWLFHCHNLYHLEDGMARVFRYV